MVVSIRLAVSSRVESGKSISGRVVDLVVKGSFCLLKLTRVVGAILHTWSSKGRGGQINVQSTDEVGADSEALLVS